MDASLALFAAAKSGDTATLAALLETATAEDLARAPSPKTSPLKSAVANGHAAAALLLLQRPDVEVGGRALQAALDRGLADVFGALVAHTPAALTERVALAALKKDRKAKTQTWMRAMAAANAPVAVSAAACARQLWAVEVACEVAGEAAALRALSEDALRELTLMGAAAVLVRAADAGAALPARLLESVRSADVARAVAAHPRLREATLLTLAPAEGAPDNFYAHDKWTWCKRADAATYEPLVRAVLDALPPADALTVVRLALRPGAQYIVDQCARAGFSYDGPVDEISLRTMRGERAVEPWAVPLLLGVPGVVGQPSLGLLLLQQRWGGYGNTDGRTERMRAMLEALNAFVPVRARDIRQAILADSSEGYTPVVIEWDMVECALQLERTGSDSREEQQALVDLIEEKKPDLLPLAIRFGGWGRRRHWVLLRELVARGRATATGGGVEQFIAVAPRGVVRGVMGFI